MSLVWQEKYSVGVKLFDSSHKKIMDKINKMNDELNAGNKKEVQSKLFDELINITEEHFSDEEKELECKEYPEYMDHLDEHKNLLNECRNLRDRYMRGEVEINLEFIGFIGNWLFTHIKDTDKGYEHLFS